MKIVMGYFSILLLLAGCGLDEATYFRKHGATQEQERIDWGLCGGGFMSNGAVKPTFDKKILTCMKGKGYQTLNEYYEEDHIEWVGVSDPSDSPSRRVRQQCGLRYLAGGICKESYSYVYRSEIPRISACMQNYGFAPALPRYKLGTRIFEDNAPIDRNFCLYLSPKNRKGGVSLGSSRLE